MVKISDKEVLICNEDIINNYDKLTSGLNPKKLLFGFSNYEYDKLIPEYTIINYKKVNKNLYLVNNSVYRLNNSNIKFDENLISSILNKYYGKEIKYHIIYEEDDGA